MTKLCKVSFNIGDEFVEELKVVSKARLKSMFRKHTIRHEDEWNNEGQKLYTYQTDLVDLVAGDRVVVQVKDTYGIATFIEYTEVFMGAPKHVELKYVIDRVDFSKFDAMRQKAERLKELKKIMDVRKEKIEEYRIYKMLAEEDEEMKKILEEYEALTK